MVDTGFATENIQAYAQALTEKPVRIAANTHGHFDHTGGNGWFDRAFMSAKALEIANIPYPSLDASKYRTNYIVTLLGDGDKIELGNRTLEVFDIPAHAPSSVAFLDRKQRILFTGDEVDDCVMLIWMQDEPQPTVEQHAANMEKLLARREDYDYICAGHNLVMAASSWVQDYRENDRLILSGEEKGEPMVLPSGTPADFHVPQREYKMQSLYKNAVLYYDNRYIHNG
jgi:glyoxylase-like metal-dependent hydrolase (beta-lactamase superfamily II)